MDIGRELVQLRKKLEALERSSRLSHASIENTAVQVYDGAGSLRGILGVQADGTTGVNIINGAAPPEPSTPTVAPALGGIAVGWDGLFANGSPLPLDWARIEVHASATPGFTPTADTLQATQETPQGGISYIPVTAATYVQLIARNTSGTPSSPTPEVGPYSPRPVAGEIGIGEIVSTMISDGSVTTPKLFANAVTTAKLAAGSVDATAIAATAITGKTITGGTVTGALIQTAATGERITLNEAAANKVLVYNAAGTAIGELSVNGLLVKGTNGAILQLDPNNAFPNLKLTNINQTTSAIINISGANALLGQNSGLFTSAGNTDWKWRTVFGVDGGSDVWAAERVRDSSPSTTYLGGRIFLTPTQATFGFQNAADATQDSYLNLLQGLAQLVQGRLQIVPPASASSGLYVNAASAHTGNLARLDLNSSSKFTVDKDGNTTAAGMLAAGNLAAGHVTITPVANTPTSVNVTGLNLQGTVRVTATPTTSVPGTSVTGVGVNNVTNTGFTVWLTRTNTSSTGVDWIAVGE